MLEKIEFDGEPKTAVLRKLKQKWEKETKSKTDSEIHAEQVKSTIKKYNEEIGDLKYLNCPTCKNKGEIALLNDDGEITYKEC